MSIPNYRTILSFDTEQNVFRARSPEVEHCFGEGKTRSEAILHLEQEIEAQLHHLQEQKQQAPKPLDEQTYSGEISTHVSQHLQKELAWQARVEGVELNQLLAEILASGLEVRRQLGRGSKNRNDGNRTTHGNREHHGNRNYGNNYHPEVFEDRANFIQYVRTIDNGSGSRGSTQRKDKNQRHQHRKNHRPHNRNRQHTTSGDVENKQAASEHQNQDMTPPVSKDSAPVVSASETTSSENTNT